MEEIHRRRVAALQYAILALQTVRLWASFQEMGLSLFGGTQGLLGIRVSMRTLKTKIDSVISTLEELAIELQGGSNIDNPF